MSKETFKEFVKKNPKLIKYVKNNEMTWQKFYEMYDLYGEDENTWSQYLKEEVVDAAVSTTTAFGASDFINWLKTINLDSVQEGIGNIQRVLGVFQDFGKKESQTIETSKKEYKPRPLYKHFED